MPTFHLKTLGCKVNHYETEQIAEILRRHGWSEAPESTADVSVVNTCSVTAEAAAKSRQAIRRAARKGNGRRVIAAGCWTTENPAEAAVLAGENALILTHHIPENATTPDQTAPNPTNDITRWLASSRPDALLSPPTTHRHSHQRAFLKIQDGCDAHCTFCAIPSFRPTLWSKPIAVTVEEARELTAAGHVEIVLCGIFLGAYGQPTALRRRQSHAGPTPLAKLIDALCAQVPGLLRLRLSSLEPGDLDGFLLSALAAHPQTVPHFHLPLQSGSDAVLRRMNRQYRQADFLAMIDRLRTHFDRPAITADVIVGFPGETDADFQQTLSVADHAGFIHIHAFPYSAKPGTPAARLPDEISSAVVSARMATLRDLADRHSLAFRQTFLGETTQVLTERDPHPGRTTIRHGRCPRYFDIHFDAPNLSPGDLATVRIDRLAGPRTLGTFISA